MDWFASKHYEDVYIVDDDGRLTGMIYLKSERGSIDDVIPPLPNRSWLKVGTLKIEGRGTKLGERIVKKIFDTAILNRCDGVYITVFELHSSLMSLFERYGFRRCGTKTTRNGVEIVLSRSLTDFTGDRVLDYPFINITGAKFWLLAIYPHYHTRLLPDSILRNEPIEIVQDVSHANTIHKVYISKLSLGRMSPGDVVFFYRTTDGQSAAHYRSVVTSICCVEEVRKRRSFSSIDDFLDYTRPRSVFDDDELRDWYATERMSVAKLTYNAALNKRITRGYLIDNHIISAQPRWDLRQLDREQALTIVRAGEIDARIIID